MQDTREIEQITFGILSSEEIIKLAVCEINSPKLCNTDKAAYNTVYDPRLGTIDNNVNCQTCNEGIWKCPGHFGYIRLNEPVIHPLYYKQVVQFIKCFCIKCNKLLISEEQILLNNLNRFKGVKRFEKIIEKLEKIDLCFNCSHPQPEIRYAVSDNMISFVYRDKDKTKLTIPFHVEEIKRMFENIVSADLKLLGFTSDLHPKNLIITVFPVIPVVARPYVYADGNICDDDLTIQIVEIIKANNHLDNSDDTPLSDTKKQKYYQSLKFRISTFYNNSSGKAKHSTSSRAIKGIKERLTGKDGLIRTNLMGKRCDQTGRTVIGPDPTLKMGQIAIPPQMAQNLTIPVTVTNFNYHHMKNLIKQKKVNYVLRNDTRINMDNALFFRGTPLNHGDIIYRNDTEITVNSGKMMLESGDRLFRNNEFIDVKYPQSRDFDLQIGDVCERQLQDGDIVLLNRQPTLHEGSMMAQEVVIRKGKTIRFNLSINKSFNADFDGDEMNIHVPASVESEAELRLLSASKYKIISSQSSKPNFNICQDSLLGAYRMTFGNQPVSKDIFNNIAFNINISIETLQNKIQTIRRVLKDKDKKVQSFNGKGLVSLILPSNLYYTYKNNANPAEPTVKIFRGVLYEGTLDKNTLGSVHNSLIQIIHKDYGADRASEFIDSIIFLTNQWLLHDGFSIGLDDCMVQGEDKVQEISHVISSCYIEAEGIKQTTHNPLIAEARITGALSKAKDMGLKIAKNALQPTNNFISTVRSGAKGDFFNIAQITGLLGQQNVAGKRVQYILNNGCRSLPHYPLENLDVDKEYESHGFITSSFINGLNPKEYYFHSMSGRESTCDTSMNTSTSGYIQRRIIKLIEDIKIQYDGTVRDVVNSIYQLNFNEDGGFDPKKMVKVPSTKKLSFINIENVVTRLNHTLELKRRKTLLKSSNP
jgi:DNA-directed RNA polymerase beta' subunit